jgi:hypothetical protein
MACARELSVIDVYEHLQHTRSYLLLTCRSERTSDWYSDGRVMDCTAFSTKSRSRVQILEVLRAAGIVGSPIEGINLRFHTNTFVKPVS